MKIKAGTRLRASRVLQAPKSKGRPRKRFAIYMNNGFRFDLEVLMDAETLQDARKEWLRLHDGHSWFSNPKNIKVKDVTGRPGF